MSEYKGLGVIADVPRHKGPFKDDAPGETHGRVFPKPPKLWVVIGWYELYLKTTNAIENEYKRKWRRSIFSQMNLDAAAIEC